MNSYFLPTTKMKKLINPAIRILLGIILLFNGVNMFAQFMPLPNPQQPDLAQRFLNILHEGAYFYPILGSVKILTAVALFTKRYLPLMLIVMFPITLNGVLFHLKMDPMMAPVALVVMAMQCWLIFVNRDKYLPMLDKGK
jgi:putative oxidoreductase